MHGNEMVLEPAFEITTRPVVPTGSGTYTIEGLDAGGGSVFRYAFDAHEIADLPHGGRAFAFAIPLASFDRTRLAALRLAGRGREVRIDGGAAAAAMQRGAAPASRLSARALGQGNIDVRWDGASYSMALIRDARTGQVLSFARGGAARIAAPGTDLVVTVSNGVRSTTETVHAQFYPKTKNAARSSRRIMLRVPKVATLAVIGTLRPTERRRASFRIAGLRHVTHWNSTSYRVTAHPANRLLWS
jgi:hypothetical protein